MNSVLSKKYKLDYENGFGKNIVLHKINCLMQRRNAYKINTTPNKGCVKEEDTKRMIDYR